MNHNAVRNVAHRIIDRFSYLNNLMSLDGRLLGEMKSILNLDFSNKIFVIAEYFLRSYLSSSSVNGERVYLKGMNSNSGSDIDAIEGAARFMPFISVVLSKDLNIDVDLRDKAMRKLHKAFIVASNSDSSCYWGKAKNYNQITVEAADYALSLWLTRDLIWKNYSHIEKVQIIKWLKGFLDVKVVDNNWNLFPAIISLVINDLIGSNTKLAKKRIDRLFEFHKGDGWFRDGANGYVDLYNAWCIHYFLFWVYIIDRDFVPVSYPNILRAFNEKYIYMFGSNGFPIFGRSPCYKYALPVPVIANSIVNKSSYNLGLARKAFSVIWDHYSSYDHISEGRLPQGVIGDQVDFLDMYSGPGSPLWGLRSVILAIYNYSDLVSVEDEMMPVERSDYCIKIPNTGYIIRGSSCDQKISIYFENGCVNFSPEKINKMTLKMYIRELLKCRPQRPDNNNMTYNLRFVTSENEVYKIHL